ncbi:MAG: serine/threonine protein kinase [Gammaproteobacteria bacterium]|nr:serine/threonine protein kinase [Gammaproteobacteria bacterium]
MIRPLKKDALGEVRIVQHPHPACVKGLCVERDTAAARAWLRPLARRLARREAAALRAADGLRGVPRLIGFDGRSVLRGYIEGLPMYEAVPRSPEYFRSALRLLAALHRRGIAHNDAAKEANWLCTPDGEAALVDFQVAMTSRRRGRVFRALAYEDLRHLLKHKRTYLPERLTARQRAVLARRGPLAMLWTLLVKPPYRFVTRVLLGWPERVGPRERQDAA